MAPYNDRLEPTLSRHSLYISKIKYKKNKMKINIEQFLSDIDQLILENENKNQALTKVFSKILNAFDCDRAWCLYPCDPESHDWGIPVEVTKHEWPGVNNSKPQMPTVKSDIESFNIFLNAKKPVTFGNGADYPTPEHVREVFRVHSQMATVIYPKHGKSWLLGIHFCERHHHFSDDEKEFFDMLGKKIGDIFDDLALDIL